MQIRRADIDDTAAACAALRHSIEAKKSGRHQCRLETTKTALRFYRAAGYREMSGTAPDGGIAMAKTFPEMKD